MNRSKHGKVPQQWDPLLPHHYTLRYHDNGLSGSAPELKRKKVNSYRLMSDSWRLVEMHSNLQCCRSFSVVLGLRTVLWV